MTSPVPGVSIGTPYGRRGSYWSCNEDSNGNGIHTGADFPAAQGTTVVAARGGKAVYCNHGSSFGYHQIEILPGDGTRDFYAHMPSRAVADGSQVKIGQKIGVVGQEGNVTGPHLHFERHKVATGGWSCSVVVNPQPSIDYKSEPTPAPKPPEEDMPKYVRVKRTTDLNIKAPAPDADGWVNIVWESSPSGSDDIFKKGESYLLLEDKMFTGALSLTATVDPSIDVIRTRFIEREQNSKGDWETNDTYPALESKVTQGNTYVVDTRVQKCNSKRLVAQVNLGSKGGTLLAAELNLLYF